MSKYRPSPVTPFAVTPPHRVPSRARRSHQRAVAAPESEAGLRWVHTHLHRQRRLPSIGVGDGQRDGGAPAAQAGRPGPTARRSEERHQLQQVSGWCEQEMARKKKHPSSTPSPTPTCHKTVVVAIAAVVRVRIVVACSRISSRSRSRSRGTVGVSRLFGSISRW